MHENFITLEQEKRDRIINAAMHEFAAKGFKNASTNEIVKKAGISKGALFHYFTTKKDLYEFLHHYSTDFFIETAEPHIKEMSADVFERWIAFAALKIEIAIQYPDMAEFMQSAYREESQEAAALLKSGFERFSVTFQSKIYEGIDRSKFRTGTDVSKALQIIWWVLEGFALQKQKEDLNLSKINNEEFIKTLINECDDYLNMLKRSFYKEEYLI